MASPLVDQRPSVAEVARTIYRTHGWRGFYAGFTPIILRAFPVNAAAYSVYEGIMRLLGAEKHETGMARLLTQVRSADDSVYVL
ncbi:hypothetical protein FRB90_010284 [Tulasnella sp. 427]|nr:hypothetical protein FRB90_010284 [Tulasnella sp. 427]